MKTINFFKMKKVNINLYSNKKNNEWWKIWKKQTKIRKNNNK
jgi:hypothetical protein